MGEISWAGGKHLLPKYFLLILVELLLLAGCNPDSDTKIQTGVSGEIGPVKVGIMVDSNGQVSFNTIWSTPDTHPANNILYKAQPGEYLTIIGGPSCDAAASGYILWQVRVDRNGVVGWTPESEDGRTFWIELTAAR
jgi:hypothetical protein